MISKFGEILGSQWLVGEVLGSHWTMLEFFYEIIEYDILSEEPALFLKKI